MCRGIGPQERKMPVRPKMCRGIGPQEEKCACEAQNKEEDWAWGGKNAPEAQ